jgi:hypothetical protein
MEAKTLKVFWSSALLTSRIPFGCPRRQGMPLPFDPNGPLVRVHSNCLYMSIILRVQIIGMTVELRNDSCIRTQLRRSLACGGISVARHRLSDLCQAARYIANICDSCHFHHKCRSPKGLHVGSYPLITPHRFRTYSRCSHVLHTRSGGASEAIYPATVSGGLACDVSEIQLGSYATISRVDA